MSKIFNYLTIIFAIITIVLAVYTSRMHLSYIFSLCFLVMTLIFSYVSKISTEKELFGTKKTKEIENKLKKKIKNKTI